MFSSKHPNFWVLMMQKMPGWAWWLGGLLVLAAYLWFFYFFFSESEFGWRALYGGGVEYPEGYEIHGIDISHHQGEINWETLKRKGQIDDSPIQFIFVKATEGASKIDEQFRDNFHNAREYGFTRGVYHFYSTMSAARAQADFFISQVHLEPGDLPPVLDVEKKSKKQTDEEFQNSVLEWLEIVEKHYKVKPILYTYHKFKMRYLNDPRFDQYPYWIAHYHVEKVGYEGAWKFWQHTDKGKISGIEGNVDLNIYNGSYYDLRQMTIGNQEPIGEKAYK